MTSQFLSLAVNRNKTFLDRLIFDKKNVPTVQLSRRDQIIQTEWTMSTQVLLHLWEIWSRRQIDEFTACLTKCFPHYYSPVSDPMVIAVDPLFQPWVGPPLYIFSPTPLILHVPLVLRKQSRWHAEVVLSAQGTRRLLSTLWLMTRPGTEIIQLPPRDDIIA